MERIQILFLELCRCSLGGRKAGEDFLSSGGREWKQLMRLADMHYIQPMIYEAVYGSPAADTAGAAVLKDFGKKALAQTLHQARMTAEFLKLYRFLAEKGLEPIVMKGIICRNLYPHPEQRRSTDEDLLIPGEEFLQYHRAFLEYGLAEDDEEKDIFSAFEVSYYNDNIYIELHKSAFPPDSKAYSNLNRYFDKAHEHTVTETVYGVPVRTLGYTDHLLYLICHGYKHFLNCGIGIRQVSDIMLFSLKYHEKIDWKHISVCCRESDMFEFVRAIYKIGDRFLAPGRFPEALEKIWLSEPVNEEPLLEDILNGGIYGTSSKDRLHSSNLTLGAMGNGNRPGVLNSVLFNTLFPSFRFMKQRYPYVRKCPFLLPFGWLHRMASYGFGSIVNSAEGNSASEALRIGNERIRLMQEYRILKGVEKKTGGSLYDRLKRVYKKSHTSILAPVLGPVFRGICSLEYCFFNTKWFFQGERRPSAKDVLLVRKNVTFLFKSFERQKLAAGLCRNISRMYPGVRIIVADDSREPLQVDLENVKILHLPFNSGIGSGLQAALNEVKTPYVVRLDDDELLTLRTKVHRELRYLHRHPELDMIGFGHMTAIRCRSPLINFEEYYGQPMDNAPKPLKIPHMTKIDKNHIVLGKVANIYLARTEKLRTVGYNPNIRVIDHDDFFRRAAGNMAAAAALDTVVFHRHDPYDRAYRRYRSDFGKDRLYIRSTRQKEQDSRKGEK